MDLLSIKKNYYSLPVLYEQVYALFSDNARVVDDYSVAAYNLFRDCPRLAKLVGSNLALGFAAAELPSYSLFCAAAKCADLIVGKDGALLLDTSVFGVRNFENFGFLGELNGSELSSHAGKRFISHFDSPSFGDNVLLASMFMRGFSSRFSPLSLKCAPAKGLSLCYPLPFVCNEFVRFRENGDVIDFIAVDKKGRLCVFAVNKGEPDFETKGRAAVCAVFMRLLLDSQFGDIQRRVVDFPYGDVVGFAVLPEQDFFEPTQSVHGVGCGVVYCGEKGIVVIG